MINLLALLMLISQVDYQEEIRNEKLKNEEINKSNCEKTTKYNNVRTILKSNQKIIEIEEIFIPLNTYT